MDNIYINITYIKELSSIINRDKETMNKFYENRLSRIMNENYSVLEKNSISYFDYTRNVKSLSDSIYTDLSNLHRILEHDIIPGYEDISTAIDKYFNIEFQGEMNKLLEDMSK